MVRLDERGWATKFVLLCAFSAAFFLPALRADATVYEVGPGRAYENIGDVPWESLVAGDTVRIHWRSEPYREKWVINRQGTADAPITVSGVPGPGGELPVIDGRDATTRPELNFWNEDRGVIKIGGSNVPSNPMPRYIVVENLDIRSARPGFHFTGRSGRGEYRTNAAAIYVETGENIVIRNVTMRDCGNGFFTASGSRNVLLEGCYIYDNGISNSIYQHNSYTSSIGITFQFNHYGPLRAGCRGNNLKDRSAGMVVRYNWIERSNRQLDIVQSGGAVGNHPSYQNAFIYGNILIERGDGNREIMHFGTEGGSVARANGYFYNNTVISTRSGTNTLVRASHSGTLDVRNNIIYTTAPGSNQEINKGDSTGLTNMSHNWVKTGYVLGGGTVNDDGTSVTGSDPGFVDFAADDFRLTADSPCRNAGTELHSEVLPEHDVLYQYVKHQGIQERPRSGAIDIGAYGYTPTD